MRCPKWRLPGEHLIRRTGKVVTAGGTRWNTGHTVAHEWLCTCGNTGTSTRAHDLPLLPTAPVVDRGYHADVIRRYLMTKASPSEQRRLKAFRSGEVLARSWGAEVPATTEDLARLVSL